MTAADTHRLEIVVESSVTQSFGSVEVRTVPREVALKKAVVAWLACWGIAVLTIPIPIVHFIAPPLLLVLGPIIGFAIYKLYDGASDIVRGEAPCPDCKGVILINPCAESWPMDLACPCCQARLRARASLQGSDKQS
jgi:hypothetical protein